MKSFNELHREWLKDAKYKKAYDSLGDEYAFIEAMIEARAKAGLTQSQLAKKMKTTQSVVARMEGGKSMPSTRTLQKVAAATGTRLRISFELQPKRSRS